MMSASARGNIRIMKLLLALSRAIDALNETVGRGACWLVLLCILISAGNAVSRYGFSYSSNGLLEIQWYLYTLVFLRRRRLYAEEQRARAHRRHRRTAVAAGADR
jgi:TRAP-type mannitol/chloroaromatic compound transport system permease small subunit